MGFLLIEEYHGLWVVERAFRVSKGTLEMRPMFHFTERRIETHICICFIAYKVYKELERLIATNKIGMSVDQVLDTAKTITTIRIKLPEHDSYFTKTLIFDRKTDSDKVSFCENNFKILIWVTH